VEQQLRPDLHPSRAFEVITADSPRHHIDVVVFESPLMRVGRWRCPTDHPVFFDSGPVSDTLFVFPRKSVWIQHDGGRPFVADPNTVTYYNKGQLYRRQPLNAIGDHCDWFAVAPEAIAETLAAHEPAAIDRPNLPFRFTHGPSDAESYFRQRMVFEHVSSEATPDRLFVEEAVLSVLGAVSGLAYQRQGVASRPLPRGSRCGDAVEGARDVIARRYRENLSLSEIAREVGTSVFYLSRLFHARTGFSLHAYRNQLRLRDALERLAERDVEITDIALDLWFSSHSHFTDTFRRSFGQTPSAVRRHL
jgi:AraC-like DNA-binding protein